MNTRIYLVEELIVELQKMPPKTPVGTINAVGDECVITEVKFSKDDRYGGIYDSVSLVISQN